SRTRLQNRLVDERGFAQGRLDDTVDTAPRRQYIVRTVEVLTGFLLGGSAVFEEVRQRIRGATQSPDHLGRYRFRPRALNDVSQSAGSAEFTVRAGHADTVHVGPPGGIVTNLPQVESTTIQSAWL